MLRYKFFSKINCRPARKIFGSASQMADQVHQLEIKNINCRLMWLVNPNLIANRQEIPLIRLKLLKKCRRWIRAEMIAATQRPYVWSHLLAASSRSSGLCHSRKAKQHWNLAQRPFYEDSHLPMLSLTSPDLCTTPAPHFHAIFNRAERRLAMPLWHMATWRRLRLLPLWRAAEDYAC